MNQNEWNPLTINKGGATVSFAGEREWKLFINQPFLPWSSLHADQFWNKHGQKFNEKTRQKKIKLLLW